ncbi:hypothetical protein PFISCL1PPCAC_7927, partial [Pristionchus fissidentatus]
AINRVKDELDDLNSLITTLVVVFIIFVVLQIVQTILQVMKPKLQVSNKGNQPNAVVVQGSSTSRRTSKKQTRSHKGPSSHRRESLPSKGMCTMLFIATESDCDRSCQSGKSGKDKTKKGTVAVGKSPKTSKTSKASRAARAAPATIPSLDITKEMAESLKLSNVPNTPLRCTTAPLAVPHTPSKSKSLSAEDSSGKDIKSAPKTAPTQPLVSVPNAVTPPIQAPPTQIPPTQAPPPAVGMKSPAVDSTQRGSVVETLPGPA